MATTYTITVNGKSYDVTVEKKNDTPIRPGVSDMMTNSTQLAAKPMPVSKAFPAPVGSGSGTSIIAPMPGTVIAVRVSVGDTVKQGQEMLLVEAMKMHNPILSPSDGIVENMYIKAGDSIQTGQELALIRA